MEHPVANFHDELGRRDELPYRIAKNPASIGAGLWQVNRDVIAGSSFADVSCPGIAVQRTASLPLAYDTGIHPLRQSRYEADGLPGPVSAKASPGQ